METAIEVNDLRVVRGGVTVLPGLSLTVPRGSVTGLLGPSGCGKSTLMRAIVGTQIVASGEVTVLGLPAGSPPLRRRVGYVTQAPSVYGDLTARENLRYFARVLGAPETEIDLALDTVGLRAEADRVVGRMSGGQRSRVSLGVALIGRPDLLVLDEPTVGLDPLLRRELWATFHALAEQGTTVLVSSHVMDEAAECELLLLMREGRLMAAETPDEVRRRTGCDDLGEAFLRLVETEMETTTETRRGGPMTARVTFATAARVLAQLRRDPRTLALLLVVPCVLLTILRYAFDGQPETFQRVGPPLIGLVPFIVMFIVASIAMLRERSSGTLERLMSMPVGKLDLLTGYALAFGLLAVVQTALLAALSLGPLDLNTARSPWILIAIALGNALLGMALGLFVSAFATTEFQAVQFMPAIVLPQLFLCGLFVARDEMAGWLEGISYALPLTYAYDALARVSGDAALGSEFVRDIVILGGAIVASLALGAATLKRRTA